MTTRIESIDALQIFDSRGVPTLEAEVRLSCGAIGRAMVPSGASTGQFEALELRDGDPKRFRGKSVFRAIEHVRGPIAAELTGSDAAEQARIDEALIALDGTDDKSNLGANAILGVSMACCRAAAAARGIELYEQIGDGRLLPMPEIQIFGGGAHANWATDVQDFMVIPIGATDCATAFEMVHNVYHAAGDLLASLGRRSGLADEGGFWPEFDSHEQALEQLTASIEAAGYRPGSDVAISLDLAASDLFHDGGYRFRLEGETLDAEQWAERIAGWCDRFPILSIEDPMADTDWPGWSEVRNRLGSRVQIIGDDLFTTNTKRIQEGIPRDVTNAVLIKLNQIGTVTQTLEAIELTRSAGWQPVVSARSGETEDTFIVDLAVACEAGQIKVGSFARSERMAKWNRMLRLELSLADKGRFAAKSPYLNMR